MGESEKIAMSEMILSNINEGSVFYIHVDIKLRTCAGIITVGNGLMLIMISKGNYCVFVG